MGSWGVSLLGWSGKGGRKCCGGGCGKWREGLVLRDHPALVGDEGGAVGSSGGVEGNVVEGCRGLYGCWGHL